MLMFLNKMRKSKVGYTLTELIVVITVLGILAVVATPFIGDYIDSAKTNTDTSNIKAVEDVFKRYAAQYGRKALEDITKTAAITLVKDELGGIPAIQGAEPNQVFVLDRLASTVDIKTAYSLPAHQIEIYEGAVPTASPTPGG